MIDTMTGTPPTEEEWAAYGVQDNQKGMVHYCWIDGAYSYTSAL